MSRNMSRKGKAQGAVGIVLLIILIAPIIMLSIPQTRTELVFHETPMGPGLGNWITSEYIEVTYIPLVDIVRNSAIAPTDVALFIAYGGLFGLAVWLVTHSRRHKLKEA